MPTALVLFTEGFSAVGALYPVDLLRRLGLSVKTCSTSAELAVLSSEQTTLLADVPFSEAQAEEFDLLVLAATAKAAAPAQVVSLVKKQLEAKKWVAAIGPASVDIVNAAGVHKIAALEPTHAPGWSLDAAKHLVLARDDAVASQFAFAVAQALGSDVWQEAKYRNDLLA